MTEDCSPIGYGTYLVTTEDYPQDERPVCRRGEIALVFSKHRSGGSSKPYNLLTEKGSTFFGITAEVLTRYFRAVYHDPHVVIDGCSTNYGWLKAKQNARLIEGME